MSFGPFRVGDSPANQITITIQDDDDSDLSDYTSCDAVMVDGTGTTVATLTAVSITDGMVTFPFPPDPFATAGVYAINPTIHGSNSTLLQLAAVEFPVEADDGWHSFASATNFLNNDFPEDPMVGYILLECAKLSVATFAPSLGFSDAGVTPISLPTDYYNGLPMLGYQADGITPVRPPMNFKQAELMQARNILNSVKTDPSQTDDGALFVIRPYPLDNFIKKLLRPSQGPLGFVA